MESKKLLFNDKKKYAIIFFLLLTWSFIVVWLFSFFTECKMKAISKSSLLVLEVWKLVREYAEHVLEMSNIKHMTDTCLEATAASQQYWWRAKEHTYVKYTYLHLHRHIPVVFWVSSPQEGSLSRRTKENYFVTESSLCCISLYKSCTRIHWKITWRQHLQGLCKYYCLHYLNLNPSKFSYTPC